MKRVMIIGSGGSGKSTLARQIGERTQLPVVHLDAFYWRANWVEPPTQEWNETVRHIVQEKYWVTDGNYGGTMEIRYEAADTIIFIDLPGWLCVLRILKRAWMYRGRTRPDMAEGCLERVDGFFLKWVWNYPKQRRPGILETLKQYENTKSVIIIRSQADIRKFLDTLQTKER